VYRQRLAHAGVWQTDTPDRYRGLNRVTYMDGTIEPFPIWASSEVFITAMCRVCQRDLAG